EQRAAERLVSSRPIRGPGRQVLDPDARAHDGTIRDDRGQVDPQETGDAATTPRDPVVRLLRAVDPERDDLLLDAARHEDQRRRQVETEVDLLELSLFP